MKLKKILKEHKDLFLGLIVISGISMVSIFGNTEWFRASILQIPEKFDGAIYPIEKVPNWFTWGGNNKTTKFSEIAQANLLVLSKYSVAVGGKTPYQIKGHTPEKQAKLTYSTVYLGNYDVQNRTEGKGSHLAVDMRVPEGTPIRAVANGKIVKAKIGNTGFGKHIVLEVRNVPEEGNKNKKTNYFVSYSHLSSVDVKVGQIVKRGQKIGKTGTSGSSTTPHLHFQIDERTAPWHPYWPFTMKEALGANLNFFTGIKKGLGKENAEKYTINPLKWIDENINTNLDKLNKKNKKLENKLVNKEVNFEILGKEEFDVNSNLELQIIAKDVSNKTIKDYKSSSEIEIISTSNTAKFSKILKFENGIAKISIENPQEEIFYFEIKVKDKKITKKLISKKIEEENIAIQTEEDKSENLITQKEKVVKLESDVSNKENKEKTEEKIEVIKDVEKKVEEKIIPQKEVVEIKTEVKKEEIKKVETEILKSSAPKKDVFIDVKVSHKNYEAIKYLKEKGIVKGYSDGTFKPAKTVSRVEAVKMIFAGLGISTESKKIVNFSDAVDNAWYSPFVGAAMQKGIVKGYSDGTFKPAKSVNRSEYYKVLLLSANINPSTPSQNPFLDVPKDSWFGAYVGFVKDTKLIEIIGENFLPSKGVSRAEVAESLYNLIKFLGK